MTKTQSQAAFHLTGGGYHSLLEPFGDFKFLHKKSSAFTLAEMMVVMLIMSIILAAMAPIMTTRIKSGRTASSSPWQWSNGVGPNAYFATKAGPKAIIGMNNAKLEDNGRLIINTENDYAHLLFKHNGVTKARLYVGDYSLVLGNQSSFNDAAENTIFGVNALANNTTGAKNVAIGYGAMFGNTSGNNNVGIGNEVLVENTTGSKNVALGNGALNTNAGDNNVAIGNAALNKNEDGADNVAIGTSALKTNTMGGGNIAIGNEALLNNGHVTTYKKINEGEENEQEVVDKIIKGDNNTAIGHQTMHNNTSGSSNIAIGNEAMFNNTTGSRNIAIGVKALHENEEGSDYIAIGNEALYRNTSGQHGVAIGLKALKSNTSGKHNIGIGYSSLLKNEEGGQNLAIGCAALQELGTGVSTLGYSNNIAIGFSASYKLQSGSNNTALGVRSLYNIESGSYNTAIGYGALYNIESGSNNTAIGYRACLNVSGSNVTCIGAGSGPASGSDMVSNDNVVYLGTANDTVYIPGNLIVYGNVGLATKGHKVVNLRMGSDNGGDYATLESDTSRYVRFSDHNRTGHGNDVSFENALIYSDSRLKYVGSENKSGLDKIRQLKIFNYTFKKDEKKTPHVGVIAQDLQKIFPNAVTKGEDGFLRIRMEDMFYALVNAVKELDAKINVILSETKDLKKQVTEILRSAQNDRKQITEILKQVQNDNKKKDEILRSAQNDKKQMQNDVKRLEKENAELKARLERLEQKLR